MQVREYVQIAPPVCAHSNLSTDVERDFSHHKQILGVKRTRLHVKNIDSRLRGIEQVKPMLLQNG
jgi:hypothetical protein